MNALRGGPLALLAAGVLVAHLWVVAEVVPDRLGGDAGAAAQRRIEVSFVRELVPAAPPAAAVPPPVVRRLRSPVAAAPAASAAEPVPELPTQPLALSEPEPPPPAAAELPTLTAALEPLPVFEWPPSTRLSYHLTGNVRGPVDGRARVEWLRQGSRYQVFMEASVGPSFAPLFSRRDFSEGEITADGLSPSRYELEQKVVLRDPRRQAILLDGNRIRLPSGQELPRPPGVQDAVSQFVHLTWLFTLQPHLLTPGNTVELTIALPRRVEPWTYDVIAIEPLDTPAGRVDTVHVKPRREPRPGGDFLVELWFAPALQYLPVRIIVRQDADTYVDLLIERLPQQAVPEEPRPTGQR